MSKPIVVGIAGPEFTGKDTTAAKTMPFIQLDHDEPVNVTWFADPIYQMVSTLTGVPVGVLRTQGYKDTLWTEATAPIPSLIGTSPRILLRDIGMWVRDNVAFDHWVQHLKARTSTPVPGTRSWWFVPDLRFENEAPVCDLRIEVRRIGIEYKNDHPSSTRLPSHLIDRTIWLTPDMCYRTLAKELVQLLADKQAAKP